MSQGLPSPNSTCTALFPGRTGHPKGTIQSPGDSDIFQRLEGPLTCTKSLVPSDSQSLTLTVCSSNFIFPEILFLLQIILLLARLRLWDIKSPPQGMNHITTAMQDIFFSNQNLDDEWILCGIYWTLSLIDVDHKQCINTYKS